MITVRSARGLHAPLLTGIGYVDATVLVASSDSTVSYIDDANVSQSHHETISFDSEDYLTFPLHEFCWQMFCFDCGPSPLSTVDEQHLACQLFNILTCIPTGTAGILIPHHLYYGAMEVRNTSIHTWAFIADPTQELPRVSNTETEIKSGKPFAYRFGPAACDAFLNLPVELLHRILTLLPSADVCHLRLASSVIASISNEFQLPPSFWASRFSSDREMGFLFAHLPPDQRESKHRAWHDIYDTCRRALQDTYGFEGLQQRRRIWRCIKPFSLAVKSVSTLAMTKMLPVPLGGLQLGQQAKCPDIGDGLLTERSTFGARRSSTQSVLLYLPEVSDSVCVTASYVSVDDRVYIAGLRTSAIDATGQMQPIHEAGLVASKYDVKLVISAEDVVNGIDVAMSVFGIHGMRFLITRSNGTAFHHSIGDVSLPDCSYAIMRLSTVARIVGLHLEFDVSLYEPPALFVTLLINYNV